ncbi:ejaculatory bulb-specific protein 3-like [Vanessa atalanta]|uniref:ejaculatory bulb-specific protein 3-like n=1 Tax=Vanessa atalanta TaxID=42275 RepID=UPI001FCE078E|nr:ejaculatory bulb-specific protein 3-like [Vanessa atalanta]
MQLALVLAFVAVVAAAPPDDNFTRYKHINFNEVVGNKDLLKPYVDCFVGTGTCTVEASEIKVKIAHAVQESCGRCSEKQKDLVSKMMNAMKTEFPEEWAKMDKIYNPDGKFGTSVNEFMQKYGH